MKIIYDKIKNIIHSNAFGSDEKIIIHTPINEKVEHLNMIINWFETQRYENPLPLPLLKSCRLKQLSFSGKTHHKNTNLYRRVVDSNT